MNIPRWFWVGLLIALFLRLALIPNPGFEADVSFWKAWGLAVVDKGIIEGLKVSNSNYPTPFMYTLGAMVGIYKLFADPHNFNEFWNNSNLLFLTISKMLPILADFGIAGIIIWIGKNISTLDSRLRGNDIKTGSRLKGRDDKPYYILALVYLLSPISLIDGAWWGQVDSVGVFIFLLAVVATLKKMPLLAGLIYMIGVMTKLQNMIYGPVFFLFVWQSLGYQGLVRAIAGSTLAFFGLNIEFFLSRNMARVMASLTENYDYFPLMSLNAYNLWWIVSGAKGMAMSDKFLALGIMNAKTVGLVLFSGVYLFAVLRQAFTQNFLSSPRTRGSSVSYFPLDSRVRGSDDSHHWSILQLFLESLILVNGAFFLFQTQSHDRYLFPTIVFILLWSRYYLFSQGISQNFKFQISNFKYAFERRIVTFSICYLFFTIFYFYNLHTALIVNYPHNGIPGLSLLTQPIFTITTSMVLLGLFGIILWHLARSSKYEFLGAWCLVLGAFLFGNLPLITKKPVSLTKFTPYVAELGYGKRQTDMPVNAYLGYSKQSFLSVQYAFYRKGLGLHSPSFFNYDIGGHFKTFTTDYGIDTEAGGKGSAVFEVYGDDKLLWRSEKIGRFENPRYTSVNVTGVKKLGLVTTDGGDGKDDDHVDWLRPTLWP